MNILVTNDDGIYSPGLQALADAAAALGNVIVMAPDVEQSSMGHAVTHSRPLGFKKSPVSFSTGEAYRVNGTPADCVALGTHLYADTELVLSGINMGLNLGNSVWHSGTLAAARQAVLLGKAGIALSTPVGKEGPDFARLQPFIQETLEMLARFKGPALFNVNFPPAPTKIVWTKQSVRLYDGTILPGTDPIGRKHYWFTVTPLEPAEEGTDRWAVENGFVSITPLQLDLTDHQFLSSQSPAS
ncbi:MAG: 5'/3'-nucleotidase SurE [Chitinophagaceae bacterium]|nr:MAG: 5'/3'-nucleotidase SurE [Chitinophagaceae bacterium]